MVIVFAAARRMAGFAVCAAPGHVDASAGPGVEPRVLQSPTKAEFAALLPDEAWTQWPDSRSILLGRVGCDQTLMDCRIVQETPDGSAFGRAVLASAMYWRLSPPIADGRPTNDGLVRLTAVWMAHPHVQTDDDRISLASGARPPI